MTTSSADCRCPLCARPNHCDEPDPARPTAGCWCNGQHFPPTLLACVAAPDRRRCICPACLAAARAAESATGPEPSAPETPRHIRILL